MYIPYKTIKNKEEFFLNWKIIITDDIHIKVNSADLDFVGRWTFSFKQTPPVWDLVSRYYFEDEQDAALFMLKYYK